MKRPGAKSFLLSAIILNLIFVSWLSKIAYALDPKELEGCICNSQEKERALDCLYKLREVYFRDNKYSEFVDLLRNLCPGDNNIAPYLNYNKALSRYQQLRYLEESKNWDEYFAKGNDYRDEIVKESNKAVESLSSDSPEFLYSKLLLYRFHKDQQDTFADDALLDLKNSALEYVKTGKDMGLIKEIADVLISYDEKSSAKGLYKLYAQSLVNSDIKDEALKDIASGFYREGNLRPLKNPLPAN